MLRKSLLGLALALFTASAALAQSDAFGYWTDPSDPAYSTWGERPDRRNRGGTERGSRHPGPGPHRLPLSEVTIDGNDVSFAMAGVPGDPRFSGTADGDTLAAR